MNEFLRTIAWTDLSSTSLSLQERWRSLNWTVIAIISLLSLIGVLMLYSAGGASWQPWAGKHLIRFIMGFCMMLVVALIDIRRWLQYSYGFYALLILFLIAVEVKGSMGGGAQRWIDLGFVQLQPSEIMKIGLILVLARYYHSIDTDELRKWKVLFIPGLLTLIPVGLVLAQPNLGTASILLFLATTLTIMSGVRTRILMTCTIAGLSAIPVAWHFMHDYQRQRVMTFLNPEADPLGSGYHIMQSKIALGSGGFFGKGYLHGTQSHLNFLPEMQTDFIFTMLAEEFGLMGGTVVLLLYTLLILYSFFVAFNSSSHFGRLLAIGIGTNLFLYMFINVGMVMGLLPVVGVPIPLLSYGGTSMLAVMLGFGLLLGLQVHQGVRIPLRGTG